MDTRRVDVAVIGAGTAGLNARRQVFEAGGSVVLIESGAYGTTCARVGCMPSKLLIAAADASRRVDAAGAFGIQVPAGWHVDGRSVLERVRRERDRFVGFVVRDTEEIPAEQRLRGRARFVGPTTLEVGDTTRIEARAVVIATGSSPWLPPPFDAIAEHVLVNDDVFELEDLPDSLAVIGTGTIGLELGQAIAQLGVRVAFFNPCDDLGLLSDPAVKRVAHSVMAERFDLRLKTRITATAVTADGVRLQWTDGDGAKHQETFTKVLVAAGRRPNLAALELENSGLELDEHGRPPWERRSTQCGNAPIFMAGDVAAHRPLLHEAADEGRIAGANAMLYPNVVLHARRTPLAIAFTEPQMAIAGCSYRELDPEEIAIGEVSFEDQGRARVMGENHGLLRIYAKRANCRLLGAEMVGPRMEHMAHLLAWAVQSGLTAQEALRMPFYHPVLEEGLRTALRKLASELSAVGQCPAEDFARAPGT